MAQESGEKTHGKMFFTIAGQCHRLRSLRTLHRHEQLLFTCTCRMERGEVRGLGALHTCTAFYVAKTLLLDVKSEKS
jgi:hypothetical protein